MFFVISFYGKVWGPIPFQTCEFGEKSSRNCSETLIPQLLVHPRLLVHHSTFCQAGQLFFPMYCLHMNLFSLITFRGNIYIDNLLHLHQVYYHAYQLGL